MEKLRAVPKRPRIHPLVRFLFRRSREAAPYTATSISFSAQPLRSRDSRLFGRPLQSCISLAWFSHTNASRACDTRRSPCSPRPCQRCLPEAPAERLRSLARVRCCLVCSPELLPPRQEWLLWLMRWSSLKCLSFAWPRCRHPSSLFAWCRSGRSWSDHSSVVRFARE